MRPIKWATFTIQDVHRRRKAEMWSHRAGVIARIGWLHPGHPQGAVGRVLREVRAHTGRERERDGGKGRRN